jgi:hypothetical protein
MRASSSDGPFHGGGIEPPAAMPSDWRGFCTGYFGVPGRTNPRGTVHVVLDGKPVCGARPAGDFQWCAREVAWDQIECKRCKLHILKESADA